MSVTCSKTRISLAVMALVASTGASAAQVGMTIASITGTYDVYRGFFDTSNPPAWQLLKVNSSVPNAQAALGDASGNANFTGAVNTGPGGNVELGKFGSPTKMSGTVGGKPIELRSLQYVDWAANGKALGYEYVGGFAAAYNLGLTQAQLKSFVDILVPDVATQPAGWQRLSDPNISYVYIDGHEVNVGLAGFLDVEQLLEGALGVQLPASSTPYQASEVVHVCLGGTTCDYLYSFVGTASGVVGPDGFSYTANYNVTIPEPESLALLGLGLMVVFLGRRRRA